MKELLTDADQPTDGMKSDLALRLWEYLQPIESVHRNKVRPPPPSPWLQHIEVLYVYVFNCDLVVGIP